MARPSAPTVFLATLYVFVASAILGFATFGLNPELIASVPGAAAVYGIVYRWVGQVQIWIAFLALGVALTVVGGLRWLPAFAAVYLLSLGSELLGTTAGIPFGRYTYSDLLGAKWFGHVPWVIPVSWFMMAVPSWLIARRALPRASAASRLLLASALLVVWDLALDPAMSALTPYWIWQDTGPYYGMPWINLAGWFLTAVVLMAVLEKTGAAQWADGLDARWVAAFYGANLLMPIGMLAAAGAWPAILATAGAYAALLVLVRLAPARSPALATAQEWS